MNFAEYQKLDAVNWSTLKEMRRSPKHYRFRVGQPKADTTSTMMGRAVHTAVLEPDRFVIDYAVFKGARRAGKDWEAFQQANSDRTILRLDEYERCLKVRDSVRSHPVAKRLLEHGEAEKTIVWTDTATGLPAKGRIDWLNGTLCDLKTTADLDPQRFGAVAARWGYHCQLAFYRQGLRSNGIDAPVKIVAVEQEAPHDVAVFTLDEDALSAGDEEVAALLQKVAECRKVNTWPGRYGEMEQPLPLPAWAFGSLFDDDSSGLDLTVNGLTVE